jgi:hypothetical protein
MKQFSNGWNFGNELARPSFDFQHFQLFDDSFEFRISDFEFQLVTAIIPSLCTKPL